VTLSNELDTAIRSPLLLTLHGWKSKGVYMEYYNKYAGEFDFIIFNWTYGWMIAKTLKNVGIVNRVNDFIDFYHSLTGQKTILIGHSNGCEIAWSVQKTNPYVLGLVFNNAALDADVEFGTHLQFVHNWYTPGDIWVKIAEWLPLNKWGGLGAKPYDGPNKDIVRNFNKGLTGPYKSNSHTDTYSNDVLRDFYTKRQIAVIRSELNEKK
jgi:pimeloyl-ACP methyl ester carboxylesterase